MICRLLAVLSRPLPGKLLTNKAHWRRWVCMPLARIQRQRPSIPTLGGRRNKLTILIKKNEVRILHIDDHIYFAVAVYILKGQGDGRQVLAGTDQHWPGIDLRFRGIAARYFNDHNVAVPILVDELPGVGRPAG